MMKTGKAKGRKNLTTKADDIRKNLLEVESWKVKSSSKKRNEYDYWMKKRLNNLVNCVVQKNEKSLKDDGSPMQFNYAATNIVKAEKLSHVFHGLKRNGMIFNRKKERRSEKKQLEELIYDKFYLERVLVDEHVRMVYLRASKLNSRVRKSQPVNRLWLEAISSKMSENSQAVRHIIRGELRFLSNRSKVQRQLSFWHRLTTLTMNQLYDKTRLKAFAKNLKFEMAFDSLEDLWRMFNRGLYSKVEKQLNVMIIYVEKWKEKKLKSQRLQLMSDMNYLRGLSFMHLKKYNSAFRCFKRDAYLGRIMEDKTIEYRTDDNIARIFAIKGYYRDAARIWKERIPSVTTDKETAWLYYNIGLCYALDGALDKAIDYVIKCIQYAEDCKSYNWELNGNLLLANCAATLGAKAEVHIRTNTVLSLKSISRAYQCAIYLANVSVIRKIMEIAKNIYISFLDVDTSLLEECWTPNLLLYVRRAAAVEKRMRRIEMKQSNINNNVDNAIPPSHLPPLKNTRNNSITIPKKSNKSCPSSSTSHLPPINSSNCTDATFSSKKSKKKSPRKNKDQQDQKPDKINQDTYIEVITNDEDVPRPKWELPRLISDDASICSRQHTPITAVEVLTTSSSCTTTEEDSSTNSSIYV